MIFWGYDTKSSINKSKNREVKASPNWKASAQPRTQATEPRGNSWNERKYLQTIYLIRDKCPKYIRNSHNAIAKIIRVKGGQRTWTDIFPKKKCKWPTGTWKDGQHHSSTGKCKSKGRDIISYLSEWLLSKRQEITRVGEDVKKMEPSCTIVDNVNNSHYRRQCGSSSKN